MHGCASRSARLAAAALPLALFLQLAMPALVAPGETAAPAGPGAASVEDTLWQLLRRGGHVVLMRHVSTEPTPGFDPPGFTLGDCATQRNLSAFGRDEARGIGAAFRARGIPVARVLSSRWCRCLETARLAFGTVEPWPALDSYHADRSRAPAQTAEVRRLAGERPTGGNVIMVTHEVNIAAATGISPAPGEMVILAPEGDGRFQTAGRLLLSVRPPG